jgi:hypothetical protein
VALRQSDVKITENQEIPSPGNLKKFRTHFYLYSLAPEQPKMHQTIMDKIIYFKEARKQINQVFLC